MVNNYAYSEVYTILNQLDENDLNKIPDDILFFIKANASEDIDYIDENKSLDEIKISKEAEDMLALLTYYYLCDNNERVEINRVMDKNEKKYQEELRQKYNPDNIFSNEQTFYEDKNNTSNIEISEVVIKKESFINKIINKLKEIFVKK